MIQKTLFVMALLGFVQTAWSESDAVIVRSPAKAQKGAKKSSPPSPVAEVESVLAGYRKAAAIQARLKKTVSNEIMGSSEPSEGHFYFSRGRLRMDIEKPEKSVLVYDGKSIWLESRMDDGNIQVSHVKADPMKRTDSLMAALFDRKDVMKQFRLLRSKTQGEARTYTFEPKEKEKTEVRYLEVTLRAADIQRVTYKDQMENSVSFEFSDIRRDKVPADKFAYKPPKNANISEM